MNYGDCFKESMHVSVCVSFLYSFCIFICFNIKFRLVWLVFIHFRRVGHLFFISYLVPYLSYEQKENVFINEEVPPCDVFNAYSAFNL